MISTRGVHKHPPHPPFSRPPSISHMFQIPLLALPSLRAQAPAPTYVSPASLRWHLKTGPAGQVHRNKAVHTLFRTGTHACICTHTQTHMRVGIQMQTCRGNSKSELPTRSGRGPRCLPRSPADGRSGSSWACPGASGRVVCRSLVGAPVVQPGPGADCSYSDPGSARQLPGAVGPAPGKTTNSTRGRNRRHF